MSMAAEHLDSTPEDPPCLRAALAMLRLGLRPVPIYPGLKKPIGEGWGLVKHTEDSLRTRWRAFPGAGVGLVLGDDGTGFGLIDFEVDDEKLSAPVIGRIFPDGLPDTLSFHASKGPHIFFRYDRRLAKYGLTRIFGEIDARTGKPKGNPHYMGVEFRIGTIDPAHPVQEQSLVPPTPRDDGEPRTWVDASGNLLPLPEVALADLSRILPIPECVYEDLDRHAKATVDESESGSVKPTWDKEEVKAAILPHALELVREWGLEITGKRPTGKKFWECRAFDREDKDPSAGFNEETGVYTDRKTGADLSLYQLGLALKAYPDFHGMVNALGQKYGVRPKTGWDATKATKGGEQSRNGEVPPPYVASVAGKDIEDEPVEARLWPEPPDDAVWHGPLGDFICHVISYTEADPIGVLVQALVGWGNLIGRKAYFNVGATRHHLNLFVCTTGPTASGRKGTAWDVARMALAYCDPDWAMNCIKNGLSSGEGLIWEVRDPIFKREPIRDKGKIIDYQQVESDPGIPDKRLMVVETELGGTLKVLTREGNTLSAQVRQAWDSGMLRSMTKNNPARATDAHVSIIGHITEEEVNRFLTQTDAANGFANRFLWVAVRQSKLLPRGALIPAEPIRPTLEHLQAAAAFSAAEPIRLGREAEAEPLWEQFYKEQSKGKPGLLGAILARATPQAMRIASLYALLDFSEVVKLPHLEAALALWRYCERSAAYIFGTLLGDRDADNLLSALRSTPDGLNQSQIVHDVFRRHKTRQEVARTLGRLLEYGLIRSESIPTDGRPKIVWHAVRHAT